MFWERGGKHANTTQEVHGLESNPAFLHCEAGVLTTRLPGLWHTGFLTAVASDKYPICIHIRKKPGLDLRGEKNVSCVHYLSWAPYWAPFTGTFECWRNHFNTMHAQLMLKYMPGVNTAATENSLTPKQAIIYCKLKRKRFWFNP